MLASSLTVTKIALAQEVGFDIPSCWDCSSQRSLAVIAAEIVFLLAAYALALNWNDRLGKVKSIIAKAAWAYGTVATLMLAAEIPALVTASKGSDESTRVEALFLGAALIEFVAILRIVRRHRRALST